MTTACAGQIHGGGGNKNADSPLIKLIKKRTDETVLILRKTPVMYVNLPPSSRGAKGKLDSVEEGNKEREGVLLGERKFSQKRVEERS